MIEVNYSMLRAHTDPAVRGALVTLAKYASEKSNRESTDNTGFDETTQNIERQKQEAGRNNGVASDLSPQATTGGTFADPNVEASTYPQDPNAQQATQTSAEQQSQPQVTAAQQAKDNPSGNTLSPQVTQSSANGSTPANTGSDPDEDGDEAGEQEGMEQGGMEQQQMPQTPYEIAAHTAQSFIGEEVYLAASQGHQAAITLIAETAAKLGAAMAGMAQPQQRPPEGSPAEEAGPEEAGENPEVEAAEQSAAQPQAPGQGQAGPAGNIGGDAVQQNQIPQSATMAAADQVIPDSKDPALSKAENGGPRNPAQPQVKDGSQNKKV